MIWKTIPGFSRYEASDEGLIRGTRAENQADIIKHREARNR